MNGFDINKIDKSKWKKYPFDQIAFSISKRVEPKDTELEVYVGLEHLDAESVHIKRTGVPSDVEGTKLLVYPGDVILVSVGHTRERLLLLHLKVFVLPMQWC